MSWAGLASNQLVTFDNLRDAVSESVFDSKVSLASIPTGNKIVTKAEASTYVWLNEGASPWSTYTDNRCPPKSSFIANNFCTIVSIAFSDILNSTGNTSYPDGTVYVVTADGTISYTVAGNYQICTRPSPDVPSSEYIYYYAYDTIQYFTVSTINFYPSSVSCSTSGCVPTSYSVLYDNSGTCAGCTGGGTSVTIYVDSAPTWTIGTRIKNSSGNNVAAGYYVYAGKCYHVTLQTVNVYTYKLGSLRFTGTETQSIVTNIINC